MDSLRTGAGAIRTDLEAGNRNRGCFSEPAAATVIRDCANKVPEEMCLLLTFHYERL